MRNKRPRSRSSGNRVHHRRFDFNIAARIEKLPQGSYDLRALRKDLARFLVCNQIEITLAISQLNIRQPVPLFGQRQQRFRQKRDFVDPNRQFAGLGSKQMPANPDRITQVEQVEQFESLIAQHILARIDLHALPRALQVRETRLTHQAIANNAAGNANLTLLGLQLRRSCGRIFLDDRRRSLGAPKLTRKRIDSQCSDLLEFFLALLKLVPRLKFQSGKNPFRSSEKYIGARADRARKRERVKRFAFSIASRDIGY